MEYTLKQVDKNALTYRSEYDDMIDEFLNQEHELCLIELTPDSQPIRVDALRARIKTRGLKQKIWATQRGNNIYLTKLNTNK